jgi:hypothetical protein
MKYTRHNKKKNRQKEENGENGKGNTRRKKTKEIIKY